MCCNKLQCLFSTSIPESHPTNRHPNFNSEELLYVLSQVENYAVLPTQRDLWPELQQTEALRSVEMDNDGDLFKPWEEPEEPRTSLELPSSQ